MKMDKMNISALPNTYQVISCIMTLSLWGIQTSPSLAIIGYADMRAMFMTTLAALIAECCLKALVVYAGYTWVE